LAALTWRKLNNKKFLSKYNYVGLRKKFYNNLYALFSRLLHRVESNKININQNKHFENLQKFIKCLPKIGVFFRLIKKMDHQDFNKKVRILLYRTVLLRI
jgi:hypothetical protein